MNWKFIRYVDTYLGMPAIYVLGFIRKVSRRNKSSSVTSDSKKILLIKFWGIGNIFMLLPVVPALKNKHAPARIDLLTLSSNREAAETSGAFTGVYTINTGSGLQFARTVLRHLRTLSEMNYDLIIDFEQFARFSALFCSFIGRNTTVGFNTKNQRRHFLYTYSVFYNNTVHITKSFLSLVTDQNPVTGGAPAIPDSVSNEGRQNQEFFHRFGIAPDQITVIMHVGTSENFRERRWPVRFFAELADRLLDEYRVTVVFTGFADETERFQNATVGMRHQGQTRDLRGKLSFRDFYAVVKSCDLLVSADTAPVHIASFAGTPVVGLYGPNTPLLYGPWGRNSCSVYKELPCSPCITNFNAKIHTCGHPNGKGACMNAISVNEVFSCIVKQYFALDAPYRMKKLSSSKPCAVS